MLRKALRWFGFALAGLLVLLLLLAAWIWFASSRELARGWEARAERLAPPTAAQLADGPRLARALGCISCHGEGLRGRIMLDIPNVFQIWSPNLTLVAARASDQQLAAAIRQGIGVDGRGLVAMPSPQYSRLTDAEVAALIAVIRAQPRGGHTTPATALGPFGRIAFALGSVETGPRLMEEFRLAQPYDLGPAYAAGRHLSAIACAECHGADLAGDGPGGGGGAPGLAIAGAYDLEQFRALMRAGRPPDGRDLGLMREVALANFSHLTDEEIAALHAYLAARAERVPE